MCLYSFAFLVAACVGIKARQELKARHGEFTVPTSSRTSWSTLTMIFDILKTVLAVHMQTDQDTGRMFPHNSDPPVYEVLDLRSVENWLTYMFGPPK